MLKAGSTIWKPMVKANCARASRTTSAPGMPTSRACRQARYEQRRAGGSSRLADRLRAHLREATHADHLAQVALDQVHHVARHLRQGDLDVHGVARAVRPHAVRDQVAPGKW